MVEQRYREVTFVKKVKVTEEAAHGMLDDEAWVEEAALEIWNEFIDERDRDMELENISVVSGIRGD